MLIEMKGNKITATMSVWVKPQGNFDDPDNMTFDACTYWQGTPRDVTAVALVTGPPHQRGQDQALHNLCFQSEDITFFFNGEIFKR